MQMRRSGKTLAAVMAAKAAQARSHKVVWATHDQAATADRLSRHGALSELVGDDYLIPHFRKGSV